MMMTHESRLSNLDVEPGTGRRVDSTRHERLLRALNELWSLPPAPGREAQMDSLILLIDECENSGPHAVEAP